MVFLLLKNVTQRLIHFLKLKTSHHAKIFVINITIQKHPLKVSYLCRFHFCKYKRARLTDIQTFYENW